MTRSKLFDHPPGLVVLFLSAMWEMFAFFGMRAVLIYYLVKSLNFNQPYAIEVYSLSNAAMFFAMLVGGYVADRFLGLRRAAIGGALVMALGFFLLAWPQLLYLGLGVIAVGNGLYKPTMWSQVGLLYSNTDTRRERGYIIFHVGNNLGAIAAPFVCGWLGEAYGWNRAFVACGAGMLVSALVLLAGRSFIARQGHKPDVQLSIAHIPRSFRYNLALLLVAWFVATLFWLSYNQIGSTFALWVDQSVARTVHLGAASFSIPAAWFQSINPLLVFALAPLVTWGWSREKASPGAARDLRKMAYGAVVLASCFVILAFAAATPMGDGKANPLWVVAAIVPYTLGELMLPPVTASLFTRLAPASLVTVFMGLFFLAQMAGNVAAGFVGGIWADVGPTTFFLFTAGVSLLAAVFALAAKALFGASDKIRLGQPAEGASDV